MVSIFLRRNVYKMEAGKKFVAEKRISGTDFKDYTVSHFSIKSGARFIEK